MEWLLRALGLFYTLAGLLYVRSFRMDSVMDKALEALEGKPQTREKFQTLWLKVGAALTVASGAALLTLSWWITPLMVLNLLVQGGYLLYARAAFPPEDAEEAAGRQRTINAFYVWAGVTTISLLVVWGPRDVLMAGPIQHWLPPLGGAVFFVWMLLQ